MSLYLSHIRLARNPSAQALSGLLMPRDAARRRSAQHNLLWSVFTDGSERERDFLWREERDGDFLALSARAPRQIDLFEPHEVKEFAPALTAGDRLGFLLRANATRMKRGGMRVDVVMDALHKVPRAERAAQRMDLATLKGRSWLERLGERAGFRVLDAEAHNYSTETLPTSQGSRQDQPRFGILDLSGRIEVTEPGIFLTKLALGFGRGKAFGCGLMLIRRVG